MQTTLAIAIALAVTQQPLIQQTTPYQDLTLDDRGDYKFDLKIENDNKFGPWIRTVDGEFDAAPGQWVRFLNDTWNGWHDAIMLVQHDGTLARHKQDDVTYALDWPWYDKQYDRWREGYYQISETKPVGAWRNQVWPKAALTIHTNNSTIYVHVENAPAESLALYGDNNTVHVYAVSGVQSRLMMDRAAVVINGDRNRIYGYIEHPMTGIHVRGDENRLVDMVVKAGAVGSDVGAYYFRGRGHKGNRATNCTAINVKRDYPASYLQTGFYLDDFTEGAELWNCHAYNFLTGVRGNGAFDSLIDRFTAVECGEAVNLAPHHTSLDVEPNGNRVRQLKTLGGGVS